MLWHSQAISSADLVVEMEKGHVKWVGSSADLSVSSYSAFSPLNECNTYLHIQQEGSLATNNEIEQDLLLEKDATHVSEEAQKIIETELRKEGSVELDVYKWENIYCSILAAYMR